MKEVYYEQLLLPSYEIQQDNAASRVDNRTGTNATLSGR